MTCWAPPSPSGCPALLAETVAEGPVHALGRRRPLNLAAAATEAHQQGLVLGCDHPQCPTTTAARCSRVPAAAGRRCPPRTTSVASAGCCTACRPAAAKLSVADAARAGLVAEDARRPAAPRRPSCVPGFRWSWTPCMGVLGQAGTAWAGAPAAALHRCRRHPR
ncbi:hypothetical protein HBB16_07990 [Pseudonocardia sp. MCCB 268]|nr:hypothetical protein [Pseudonocardia cytotoxica]